MYVYVLIYYAAPHTQKKQTVTYGWIDYMRGRLNTHKKKNDTGIRYFSIYTISKHQKQNAWRYMEKKKKNVYSKRQNKHKPPVVSLLIIELFLIKINYQCDCKEEVKSWFDGIQHSTAQQQQQHCCTPSSLLERASCGSSQNESDARKKNTLLLSTLSNSWG